MPLSFGLGINTNSEVVGVFAGYSIWIILGKVMLIFNIQKKEKGQKRFVYIKHFG